MMSEGQRCESCGRKRKYLGPDYGASHFFCEDCLAEMELNQPRNCAEALEIAEARGGKGETNT